MMKKPLVKIYSEYFGKHIQLKKTEEKYSNILIETNDIQIKEIGDRKKYSEKFLSDDNAFTLEDVFSDIVVNPYKNVEVFFLIKTEEGEYLILRHFKSLKKDLYFANNLFLREKFDKEKVLKEALFFFKKK